MIDTKIPPAEKGGLWDVTGLEKKDPTRSKGGKKGANQV